MPNLHGIPELPDALLEVVPVFGPDPRQEMFISGTESDEVLLANLKRGYPASCPDLSFLQWMAHAVVRRDNLDRKDALRATVVACVQRVETISTKTLKEDSVEVAFSTTDDFGRYRHALVVDFKVKSYPPPPAVLKQLEYQEKEKHP